MKAQVTEQTFRVPCETHRCRNRAAYKIGDPKFPHSCHNLCEDCMKDIAKSIPKELLERKIGVTPSTQEPFDFMPVPLEEPSQENEPTVEPKEQEEVEITSKTHISTLRSIAKRRGINVESTTKKEDLLRALGVE